MTKEFNASCKEFIEANTSVPPQDSFLFGKNQHLILRLLFLDDLKQPTQFSWPYELLLDGVCNAYHNYPEFYSELQKWLAPLSTIILPQVRRNLIIEVFLWPMFLAAIANDNRFFILLSFDFEFYLAKTKTTKANGKPYANMRKFVKAIRDIAQGTRSWFPVDCIDYIDTLLHDRSFTGTLGWKPSQLAPLLQMEPHIYLVITSESSRRHFAEIISSLKAYNLV